MPCELIMKLDLSLAIYYCIGKSMMGACAHILISQESSRKSLSFDEKLSRAINFIIIYRVDIFK